MSGFDALPPFLDKLLSAPHLYRLDGWVRGRAVVLGRELTEEEALSVVRVIEEFRPLPGERDREAERQLRALRGHTSRDVVHSRS